MLTLVIASLTTFVALANVSDTLLAKQGDRLIRQRLVDFYVSVESDWRGLYRSPAVLLGQVMRKVLGTRPVLAALRFLFISLLIFTLVLAGAAYSLVHGVDDPILAREVIALVPRLAACNVISDAISWIGAIWIIRKMETASAKAAAFWILAALGVWLVAWTIQMELVFFVLLNSGFFGHVSLPAELPTYALRALLMVPTSIWVIGRSEGELFASYFPIAQAFGIVAALPILMYALSTAAGVLAFLLRPILQRPLAGFLTRLEASDRPVLTTVAIILSAIAAVLAVWVKVFWP